MPFTNARIAVLEARMRGEMADLIRRQGGISYSVPAVREVSIASDQPVSTFIDQLSAGAIPFVVFFTGVGANTLFQEAERLGRKDELLTALRNVAVLCRGPKPLAVLKRSGISVLASAAEPFTTVELLEILEPLELSGRRVGVVHYGERNTQVAEFLRERGAFAEELCLYEWLLPADTTLLQTLVRDLLARQVDAVMFTSQIQVRHLLQIATELDVAAELVEALRSKTVVASIGPTCTGVLQSYGITPHVVPEHPKMGYLVKALAAYMTV